MHLNLRPLPIPSRLRPVAGALLVLCSTTGWAGQGGEDLDFYLQLSLQELLDLETSIASGTPSSILKSISTVSVITREDIERYHYTTLEEALRTIAGFDVYRTYFQKGIATSRGILQDHYTNKVLLMINHVPAWHAVTGELHLARINIHDVEKIEVLKGPASVLYGTNAYSGAINVVLRDGSSPRRAYVEAGDDDHYAAGGTWTHLDEERDLSLLVAAHGRHGERQRGRFVDEDGVSDHFNDFTDSTTLTVNGRLGNHSLLLNAYDNTEAYMGIEPFYDLGVGRGQDLRGHLIGYQYETRPDEVSTLRVSTRYDWNERAFLRSISQGIRGETSGYHLAGNITYARQLSDRFQLDGGIDVDYRVAEVYRNFDADGNTLTHNNLRDRSVLEYSVFTSLGYEQGDWKWNIGLRRVENELFSGSLSGRATLVYSLSDTSSVKLIAGQSFRSPSLFELYFIPPEQTIFGNPDLSPEKSTSYEIAYLKFAGNLFFQVNAYRASYRDRIYRDRGDVLLPDGSMAFNRLVYSNGDTFHATGVEFESRYNADPWAAFANINWQRGTDGDRLEGTRHYNFRYVPSYTVSAGLSRNLGAVNLSAVGNYRSGTSGTTPTDIDDSLTVDLAASFTHQPASDWQLHHRVKLSNITDERVEIADYARRAGLEHVPQRFGRSLTYQLTLTF